MLQFNHYAAPMVFGPYKVITKHMGFGKFDISYHALSDATTVFGKVKYFKTATEQVEEEFSDETTIHVGDCVATIELCFKGSPFGSGVEGTINPDGLGS